jgi:hypothetical protein
MAELAAIEEHLLTCSQFIDAAEEAPQYVDALRAAIIRGDYRRIATPINSSISKTSPRPSGRQT